MQVYNWKKRFVFNFKSTRSKNCPIKLNYKRAAEAPNDAFLLNTLKTLFRLCRVVLDLKKYILSGGIKLDSVRSSWGICVFSKLQGLQNYFSQNFRCNLSFYECENFSDSSLNNSFESESFMFRFSIYLRSKR